jgi:beta-glucosidase
VVDRPAKVLKAFTRVALEPGQTKVIRFDVDADDLRYRDPATHTWKLEPGVHTVFVGGSAALADQLSATISL